MKSQNRKPTGAQNLGEDDSRQATVSELAADLNLRGERWSYASDKPPRADVKEYSKRRVSFGVNDLGKIGKLTQLIAGIRGLGYTEADLNPLAEPRVGAYNGYVDDLGVDADILDLPVSSLAQMKDLLQVNGFNGSARDFIVKLQRVYCRKTGYEFAHIRDSERREWLYRRVENADSAAARQRARKQRPYIYQMLLRAEVFEQFLHRAYPGQRWYSLEGLESVLLLVNHLVLEAISDKVDCLMFGMAHRGRLNFLTHLLNKQYEALIDEFSGIASERVATSEHHGWLTDVKYHQGGANLRDWNHDGSSDIRLHMLPNPSHLELTSPAVLGAVRAILDKEHTALGVLLHGDAALAGQGIVAETLNLANLPGYSVGGAIHIVMNNQIGFTTAPSESFSGEYATDLARGFDIPIVHVNGDSVSDCVAAACLAADYRKKFKKDIVIDVIGYRRYGHNESDDPSVTQPEMYAKIAKHPTLLEIYGRQMIADNLLTADKFEDDKRVFFEHLFNIKNERESAAKNNGLAAPDASAPRLNLASYKLEIGGLADVESEADADLLRSINRRLTQLPDKFAPHKLVGKTFAKRADGLETGDIDWGHAESLALGALINQGFRVRLSGQDSVRGTFGQRHAQIYDRKNGKPFNPFAQIGGAGVFEIYNSPLSEASALSFEYGYSTESPNSLVIWEAQFGDFVNNAQSVVDELIVSGAAKWGQSSGLALLLPHGYEGQGPNHSSAHLERFLSLAASNNMRILFPTTAAQYFHALRAHAIALKDAEVPAVIVTGKSLLRHPLAKSSLQDLSQKRFQPVRTAIPDGKLETVANVVLCSGKVFVDLLARPNTAAAKNVMFLCIEELYPLPHERIKAEIQKIPAENKLKYHWLQEEPRNRGAFRYINGIRHRVVGDNVLNYIGRPATASAAEGVNWVHKLEQNALLEEAIRV